MNQKTSKPVLADLKALNIDTKLKSKVSKKTLSSNLAAGMIFKRSI